MENQTNIEQTVETENNNIIQNIGSGINVESSVGAPIVSESAVNVSGSNNDGNDKNYKPILIVLVLLVIGLVSFGIYLATKDRDKKPEKKEIPTEENEPKVNVLEDSTVKELYNYLTNTTDMCNNQDTPFYETQSLLSDNMSDWDKLAYASKFLTLSDIIMDSNSSGGEDKSIPIKIKTESVKKVVQKLFGNDVKFENVNFDSGYSLVVPSINNESGIAVITGYDKKTDEYTGFIGGTGCGGLNSRYYKKLVDATKTEDTIILNEKFVKFIPSRLSETSMNGLKIELYTGLKLKTKVAEYTENGDSTESFKIDGYLDKLSTVEYTFKKGTNGEYYFYSSEIK